MFSLKTSTLRRTNSEEGALSIYLLVYKEGRTRISCSIKSDRERTRAKVFLRSAMADDMAGPLHIAMLARINAGNAHRPEKKQQHREKTQAAMLRTVRTRRAIKLILISVITLEV